MFSNTKIIPLMLGHLLFIYLKKNVLKLSWREILVKYLNNCTDFQTSKPSVYIDWIQALIDTILSVTFQISMQSHFEFFFLQIIKNAFT